jgi:hypothetical protein
MVFANLIGFGNGWFNMEIIFKKILEPGALYQLFLAMSSMYCFPIFQFYIRDRELDKLGGATTGF